MSKRLSIFFLLFLLTAQSARGRESYRLLEIKKLPLFLITAFKNTKSWLLNNYSKKRLIQAIGLIPTLVFIAIHGWLMLPNKNNFPGKHKVRKKVSKIKNEILIESIVTNVLLETGIKEHCLELLKSFDRNSNSNIWIQEQSESVAKEILGNGFSAKSIDVIRKKTSEILTKLVNEKLEEQNFEELVSEEAGSKAVEPILFAGIDSTHSQADQETENPLEIKPVTASTGNAEYFSSDSESDEESDDSDDESHDDEEYDFSSGKNEDQRKKIQPIEVDKKSDLLEKTFTLNISKIPYQNLGEIENSIGAIILPGIQSVEPQIKYSDENDNKFSKQRPPFQNLFGQNNFVQNSKKEALIQIIVADKKLDSIEQLELNENPTAATHASEIKGAVDEVVDVIVNEVVPESIKSSLSGSEGTDGYESGYEIDSESEYENKNEFSEDKSGNISETDSLAFSGDSESDKEAMREDKTKTNANNYDETEQERSPEEIKQYQALYKKLNSIDYMGNNILGRVIIKFTINDKGDFLDWLYDEYGNNNIELNHKNYAEQTTIDNLLIALENSYRDLKSKESIGEKCQATIWPLSALLEFSKNLNLDIKNTISRIYLGSLPAEHKLFLSEYIIDFFNDIEINKEKLNRFKNLMITCNHKGFTEISRFIKLVKNGINHEELEKIIDATEAIKLILNSKKGILSKTWKLKQKKSSSKINPIITTEILEIAVKVCSGKTDQQKIKFLSALLSFGSYDEEIIKLKNIALEKKKPIKKEVLDKILYNLSDKKYQKEQCISFGNIFNKKKKFSINALPELIEKILSKNLKAKTKNSKYARIRLIMEFYDKNKFNKNYKKALEQLCKAKKNKYRRFNENIRYFVGTF